MPKEKEWRISILLIIVFIIGGFIISRLFLIQILACDRYRSLAAGQHQIFQELFPNRGEIFIQDLKSKKTIPIAINRDYKKVYAVPKDIEVDHQELAQKLASILSLDQDLIFGRISKENDPYEPLKSRVEEEVASQIEEMGIKGIRTTLEPARFYPASTLASHVIGFVGFQNDQRIGQYGLEGSYEQELKGSLGALEGRRDTSRRIIPTADQKIEPAQDGADLILTIDQNIQFKAEKELKATIEKWQAEAGTVIIANPKTGAIYAMASWPNFDSNNYSQVKDIDTYLNPAIQKIYEPGSVVKVFTMAAGLDSGAIRPTDTFIDSGILSLPGGVIRNATRETYGQQTMSQILEKSINTGSVFVQQKMSSQEFKKYIQAFGFGQKTNIDLSGELSGSIMNLFTNREIDLATISFGQGMSVTPMQLVAATSAIANQGKLMKPYLVEKKIIADQEEITQPQFVTQVISPQTAEELTKMLVQVVDVGQSGGAKVRGYNLAGKTGTAQIPIAGGYSENETIHTFIGFGPAFEAQFTILLKIEKAKNSRWAATTLAPAFGNLAEYLLNYFEIAPAVNY